MNLSDLTREKKRYSDLIKSEYSFPKNNKCIGLIKVKDEEVLSELIKAMAFLPINFIVISDEAFTKNSDNIVFIDDISTHEIGVDFVVFDDNESSLSNYFKKGITPIVSSKSHLVTLLNEFNPMKNLGNSFLYDDSNAWSIFYALVRYMENYKFPFDNKNLVKNVFES